MGFSTNIYLVIQNMLGQNWGAFVVGNRVNAQRISQSMVVCLFCFCYLELNMNAHRYVEILDKTVMPFISQMATVGSCNIMIRYVSPTVQSSQITS